MRGRVKPVVVKCETNLLPQLRIEDGETGPEVSE